MQIALEDEKCKCRRDEQHDDDPLVYAARYLSVKFGLDYWTAMNIALLAGIAGSAVRQ